MTSNPADVYLRALRADVGPGAAANRRCNAEKIRMSIWEDPTFVDARRVLDGGGRLRRELEKVARLLAEVEKRYPEDPVLLNAYARLFRRTGEPGRLYESLLKAQALCSIEQYASPWDNLGLFWEEFRLWQRAKSVYETVLSYHPDDAFARERLGKCDEQTRSVCSEFRVPFPPSVAGDAFLIRVLELLLAAGVRVKAAKTKLKDNAGLDHEIDLLFEVNIFLDQGTPVIVECKDWSRAVDRRVVDQFRSFLDHSQYKLGIIIVSGDLTDGARAQATAAGIPTYSWREVESMMGTVLRRRVTGRKVKWVRDLAAARGPSSDELARMAAASARFVGWATRGALAVQPEAMIDRRRICVGGQPILWFEENELATYEEVAGPFPTAPFAVLLLLMSWWNHIDDLAHAA